MNIHKQAEILTENKRLTAEKEDAIRIKLDIESKCNQKIQGCEQGLREVSLQLLEQEKYTDELKKERNNLKEIAFDLMEERDRSNPTEVVEVRREPTEEMMALLKFSNEQIKSLSEQIEKYRVKVD